jgi:hypothetical protein
VKQFKTEIIQYVGLHSMFLGSCNILLKLNAGMQETGNSFYIIGLIMFMEVAYSLAHNA